TLAGGFRLILGLAAGLVGGRFGFGGWLHRWLDFGDLLVGRCLGGFRLLFQFSRVGKLFGRCFSSILCRLEGCFGGIDRVSVVFLFDLDFLERFLGIRKCF